jgi:hypothetical protein
MEYTAEQFEIEFFTKYVKWLKGGRVGPDPRDMWQFFDGDTENWESGFGIQPVFSWGKYRWKPIPKRTVVIDGKTLVAPEREPLENGQAYFKLNYFGRNDAWCWDNSYSDMDNLNFGLIFLTQEDAQAMFEAQKAQRLA